MLVETNVLIRHLTGDPPEQAARASAMLAASDELILTHVIAAECFNALTSVYALTAAEAAAILRRVIGSRQIRVAFPALLERSLEHCERGMGFADGYLCALAELSDAGPIASFDRGLDAVAGVERVEP